MKKAFLSILCILTCVIAAYAAPQPTLSMDFENGVNGVGQNGQIIPARVEGKTKIVDGNFGKGFQSGPSSGYLYFPTKGVLSLKAGTVEMWVCPVNWSGDEKKFHVFFDAHGAGALYLYKFWTKGLLMLSTPDINRGPFMSIDGDINNWKPGQWHQIVGTWSANLQSLYIDGKHIADARQPALPTRLDNEFMLGDKSMSEGATGPRTSSTLIDRVRVYDHVLSPELIAAHYAGDYQKSVSLSPDSATLNYDFHRGPGLLTANIQVLGADYNPNDRVVFSLAQNGKEIKSLPAQAVESDAQFDLNNLREGDYQITATIKDSDALVTKLSNTIAVPSREWLGNKLGKADKVLSPWTPMQVEETGDTLKVNCWGRSYEFSGTALPSQIVAQSETLLAHPISLNAIVDRKLLQWSPAQLKVLLATPTLVNLEATTQAAAKGGLVKLKTRLHFEFDGMMLMDFTLTKPANVLIENMSLDMPMLPQRALYRHRWSSQWKGMSGDVPAGQGVVDHAAFIPYSWLGDNDRGLFWFCESGEFWPNSLNDNAYETRRETGTVSMQLNLLEKGQTLPVTWKFECGLQATPVKPVPRDWRKFRVMQGLGGNLTPTIGGNLTTIWPQQPSVPISSQTMNASKVPMKYFGSPRPENPEYFEKYVQNLHDLREVNLPPNAIFKKYPKSFQPDGVRAQMYSWLPYLSSDAPEWKWFESQWKTGEIDGSSFSSTWPGMWEGVSMAAPSYSDFVVWENYQAMKNYGLDGLYHDESQPYACTAESAGCGWRDATGTLQPTFQILAYRKIYKRIYAMAKDVDPNAFLIVHTSGKIFIPVSSFEDAYLDGENFRTEVKVPDIQNSYTKIVPMDYWRAELMGRQWGLAPYFLNEYGGQDRLRDEPNTNYMGLLLLHDVAPWAISSGGDVLNDTFSVLDKFGYNDAEFIPYFDEIPPATTEMKDVYISVYKRQKDGRALAVIVNNSFEDRSGTVTLNDARIGLTLDSVVSWPDKTPIQKEGATLTLTVPKQGFRLLLIGKAP
jgi:hypothetical protein